MLEISEAGDIKEVGKKEGVRWGNIEGDKTRGDKG